ncbi:MAG: 2'-5' RNA ligase family protein [Spirochaetes bacterium]|nr:2'-5' RNA ligase family protein [Spirochaetota bacterium]
MKCAFAYLVSSEIHNYIRKKAIEIDKYINNGFYAAQLPPHVSLKQPFKIDDLAQVEKFFDRLSSEMAPVEIEFRSLYRFANGIFLDVCNQSTLMEIHKELNRRLEHEFKDTKAAHDGDKYHFHATIALQGSDMDNYKNVFEKVNDNNVNLKYLASEMVMFYYSDDNYSAGSFITYKINKLGKK